MKVVAKPVHISARRLEALVACENTEQTMYFESDSPLWERPPQYDDYIVAALSQFCAHKKCDLYVEGTVTQSMLRHADEFIKIWSVWRPDLFSQVQIRAKKVAADTPGRDKPAALAFSGGVDACFSLAAHKSGLLGASSREIGLGVQIVGMDLNEDRPEALLEANRSAKAILDSFGVPMAVISTNQRRDFCPEWKPSLGAALACVLHTLTNDYSAGIISGNYDYLRETDIGPDGVHTMFNRLLGSYTFPVVSTGGTHNRVERVGFLCGYPAVLKNLRVCLRPEGMGRNCGVCEKCIRTRLDLLVYGQEPDIFNRSVTPQDIEAVKLDGLSLVYYEDIFKQMSRSHPLFEAVEKVYQREKKEWDAHLRNLVDLKNAHIANLQNENDAMKNSASYRLTKPLRALRGLRVKKK